MSEVINHVVDVCEKGILESQQLIKDGCGDEAVERGRIDGFKTVLKELKDVS